MLAWEGRQWREEDYGGETMLWGWGRLGAGQAGMEQGSEVGGSERDGGINMGSVECLSVEATPGRPIHQPGL